MNSFETDLKRSIISVPFLLGVILEVAILIIAGIESDIFRVCVPVLSTFPYATAWLGDYQSGFIKSYIPRIGIRQYIIGKIAACGISGGLLEVTGCLLYAWMQDIEPNEIHYTLIFVSAMFWAVVAATLAAWSNSRYIAYGGSFVIYYLLVILYDRYFKKLYCLCPYEWLHPEHIWVFEEQGVVLLVVGLTLIFGCIYYWIVRRCIERV